jgi:hypothetical protein
LEKRLKLKFSSEACVHHEYSTGYSTVDWQAFRRWLLKEYEIRTAEARFRYAKKFSYCLFNGDFSDLHLLSNDKRCHVLKALSALAKFLGVYNHFKFLVSNYGVKWAGKRSEDLIIQRLTRTVNNNSLADWMRNVKKALPELSLFLDFVASTGLRFEDAVKAWNLIIDLSGQGRLGEYYNVENQALEHFRFKEIFIRRSKKCFVSFISKPFLRQIANQKIRLNRNIINCRLKRRNLQARFSDLREYYATAMTKYLRQPEIDFLQGRIGVNVFMRNYFNPAWIQDLKNRALKGANELMQMLNYSSESLRVPS